MKTFKILFGIALFCNVIAIAILLYRVDADVFSYVNLVGCVIFGLYVREMN